MLRKDSASVTSNTFTTRDPKECMANTSNPTKVNNIDNSALYAYKVNKTHLNSKAKQETPKRNKKKKKGKRHKGNDHIKQNTGTKHNNAWNLMDIQDMHEFIKHLNYAIVLLDLVRDKANSPVRSTNVTTKCQVYQ